MKKLFLTTTILFSSLFCLVSCSDEPVVKKDDSPVLGCTEIMYNSIDSLEFVELKIMSGPSIADMAVANLRLEGAVNFMFPNESLDTGEYIVVTNNPALFNAT